MEIIIEKSRLYIWALVAMCGELAKQDLIESLSATPQNTYAEIRKLKNEKILTEAKTENGPVLRLAYPLGVKMLESIPPLKDQYDIMTSSGQKNNSGRFHNSGSVLKKRLERSRIILMMINKEISVNNIRLRYIKKIGRKRKLSTAQIQLQKNEKTNMQEIDFLQGTDIPEITYIKQEKSSLLEDTCEEILREGNFQKPNYFTSNIIKRYKDGTETYSQTLSINPSRMHGAIIGTNTLAALYYIKNEKIRISQKAEKAMVLHLDRTYKAVYGEALVKEQRKFAEKGVAIIYIPDVNVIKNIIKKPGTNKAELTDIYSRVYAVDINDKDQTDKILTPRYEQEIIESIYDEDEIRKASEKKLQNMCDAITDEGLSIEAVTMNLSKIEKSIKMLDIPDTRLEVFCRKIHKDILEDIYSPYRDKVTITALKDY